MDFYRKVIVEKKAKKEEEPALQIRPDWKVGRSTDLMTRGGSFYAIWDETVGLWSQDIYDVQRLVDADLVKYAEEEQAKTGVVYSIAKMENHSSKLWEDFMRFIRSSGNNSHNLDEKLIFANTEVRKEDYASKKLDYVLAEGPCPAWDTIVGTLYNEEESAKIEWAIGAVVSGDSKIIQKFLVFYGPPGSGKSTILNIIERLFAGYTSVFDARELAGNNNTFATAAFKSNPLVAIQHDGDLSRIYDNTKLNSIVAHETLTVNEKYKTPFESKSHAFLFMGTNAPVKITDAKSGIIRRLIDVVPTQKTIEQNTYHMLMDQVNFELGHIAYQCLIRYKAMGKNYYSSYRPTEMMLQTDVFYNYVEAHFDLFKGEDGVGLKRAYSLYKEYCSDTGIDKVLPQYKFREELKSYFYVFEERARIDGENVRSYYRGFKHMEATMPSTELPVKPAGVYRIELDDGPSIFDEQFPSLLAQYARANGNPQKKWVDVTTTLGDLDTTKLHFVKIPENHIIIDFDLINEDGEKDLELNLTEASKWPPTYTELSKSGKGIHLHYVYTGNVHELASVYDVGIEIKTLLGDASLRRLKTKCNHVNITPLDGGLPKKEKPVLTNQSIKSEKGIRDLIARNLRKEIHPGTKPSVDFIKKILDEAYDEGMSYDLTDMRSDILAFAMRSTNQAQTCMKIVQTMKFVGQPMETPSSLDKSDAPIAFFDIEVYPNLLVVSWKYQGAPNVVRMINPTPEEIEVLFGMKLVGFNNRRYDNHILYARFLGYSNEALYDLSYRLIVGKDKNAYFVEAYNISYADIFDFSSKKQGLKKFQIELGIHHMELDIPWDQPVAEHLWTKVAEYCDNDVISTEKVFESRKQDFVARQILAELSGLTVNHTTQNHTAKIIFGSDKNPQSQFIYTDLSEQFPGYKYDIGVSTYRGEVTGEGGYVYAEPGIYTNVALLDVASMHPTSILQLNAFGKYTSYFAELLEARLAIKKKDFETAKNMMNGRLAPFLEDTSDADALSYALKIVINIVYGLTSAKFNNPFRDIRNKDNIVAKRGALFMIDLKHACQDMGWQVVHIKTDSIKLPDATPEMIAFVTEFGKKYGYDFEHEVTYEKFCLVNDAVYIARSESGKWTAVGAQFQHPYVFKTLFSGETLTFDDYCETKSVTQGAMYLDFSGTGEVDKMIHVGRTGSFVPVGEGGGDLWRVKDDKKYAVTGTKGYKWIDRDVASERNTINEFRPDMSYFEDLVQKAIQAIVRFDTFDEDGHTIVLDDIKHFIS